MNQRELDRAVARATGESINRIQRMGFSLIVTPMVVRGREQRPLRTYRQPAATASVSREHDAVSCS